MVNDKKPHQDEASEREFRQQLGEHFRELATSKLPGQDWTNRFFWVRAKSAERGRLELKEGLVLGSGIVPLEHALTPILRESDATVRAAAHLRALQDEMRSLTTSFESASETVELRGIDDALQRCDMARCRLDAVANLVVEDSFSPLKDSISAVLQRAISGKAGKDAVATEVTDLVRGTYQGAFASFRRRCETELADLATRAEREIKNPSHENRSDPEVHLGDIPALEEGTMDPPAMLRRFAAGPTALREAIAGAQQAMGSAVAKAAAVEAGAGRERRAQEMAAREAEAKAELAARTSRQQFLAEASALVAHALPEEGRTPELGLSLGYLHATGQDLHDAIGKLDSGSGNRLVTP